MLSAFKATVFVRLCEMCLSWLLVLFVHAGIWSWLAFAYPGFLGLRDISQGLELVQVLTYGSQGSKDVLLLTPSPT